MKKRTYVFGSVSHGTVRDTDLLESFSDTLEYLAKKNNEYQKYKDIIQEAKRYRNFLIRHKNKLYKPHHEKMRAFILETVSCIINEDLFNALDKFAPIHHYFGSHPGDGADYGFWLSEN